MAVSLKHKFASSKSNGLDATRVQPTNWNDEHDLELASGRLLGRATAGVGPVEEITFTPFAATLLDDVSAAAARTTLGLGTLSTQAANDVAITGGSINGTNIGGTTPAVGTFTSLNSTSNPGVTNAAPGIILSETGTTTTFSQTWLVQDANEMKMQTRNSAGDFVSTDYNMTKNASGATAHSFRIAGVERMHIDDVGVEANGTGEHLFRLGNTTRLNVSPDGIAVTGSITFSNKILPATTNVHDIGSTAARIRTIFLLDAPNVSSDARLKENIEYLTLHERRAAANIRARTFNMIEGGQKKIGYIAQEVIEAMAAEGLCAFEYGLVTDGETYGVDMDAINAFRLG